MKTKENKALHLLFNPEHYPSMSEKKATDIKIVFWRNDSLGEFRSWTLFDSNEYSIVRRVIWERHTAYNLKEPETYCADAVIPRKLLNSLIDSLQKLDFSSLEIIESGIYLDAIENGIIFQNKEIKWFEALKSEQMFPQLSVLYQQAIYQLEMVL